MKKLLEYHKNNNIKYYVACKANGDGMGKFGKIDAGKQVYVTSQHLVAGVIGYDSTRKHLAV